MPNFLDQIKEIDTKTLLPTWRSRLEPRRERRQKARDAAEASKRAIAPVNNSIKSN